MRAERALFGSWFATALGIAGLLVPKCPLCAAAYLCLFGVSAGSAQAIVKLGVPLCLGLIFASALGTALFVAHRGRRLQSARPPSSLRAAAVAGSAACAVCNMGWRRGRVASAWSACVKRVRALSAARVG